MSSARQSCRLELAIFPNSWKRKILFLFNPPNELTGVDGRDCLDAMIDTSFISGGG